MKKAKKPTTSKPKKRKFVDAPKPEAEEPVVPKKKEARLRLKTWQEVEEGGAKINPPDMRIIPEVEHILLTRYPSPDTNAVFTSKWNQFIKDIADRENFKVGHLNQLSVLCDLYVEYDLLKRDIRKHGYTFEVDGGRNGPQVKTRPESTLLMRCRADIATYSKALGLLLVKDKNFTEEESDETAKWK